jgi:DNA invertase Pin-like site-specific DNA recombinase
MKTAAIYCRVSSDMQAEDELPILGQIEEYTKCAENEGCTIYQVYPDEGFSGRNNDRQAFARLLSDAKKSHHPSMWSLFGKAIE